MYVHDLGSLSVEADGLPVVLNGKRMAAALAVLLINLNEKVRTDTLIEAVWGAEPSPRAPAALDTLLWRLRRVLDPGRPSRSSSAVLQTEQQGYRLTLPPETVDSCRFEAAARAVSQQDSTGDPQEILELTGSALTLWRGRPYDDVDDDGWLEPTRARLSEQHLVVQVARLEALLAAGQPELAVTELVPILAEHPFAERLWCLRLLALYQAGRPAAALEAYADVRRTLDRELGMQPGAELRAVHERILRQDRSLASPPPQSPHGVVRIPEHRTTLFGRDEDLDILPRLLAQHRLVSLVGSVGSGKTRLAAAVARRVDSLFPDGVCFVDLSDLMDPAAVAARVHETLHVQLEATGTPEEGLARFIAGRQMLIVLGNCEQVTSAARALATRVLNYETRSRILVTSRRVLAAPDEVVYNVRPLAPPVSDGPSDISASPAAALFVERAASRGIVIDATGADAAAIAQICQAVDGLPLGIELAASRAQIFALHEIAAGLSLFPMALSAPNDDTSTNSEFTLREAIEGSHRLLTEREKIAHRRLSILPPRFTLEAAVAVCSGTSLEPEDVPTALIGLSSHSLLEATRPERADGPSLFRQLVPIRAHAAQQLAAAGETDTVKAALLDWVSTTLANGPRLGQSGSGALDRRLEDNRRTITAALEATVATNPSDKALITLCRLVPFWWLDGKLSPETVRLVATAASAVSADNSAFAGAAAAAAHHSFQAMTHGLTDERALLAAIECLSEAPAGSEIFAAEFLITVAAACWTSGHLDESRAAADAAAAYGERLQDAHVQVLARAVRCASGLSEDPAAAARIARPLLDESLALGNASAAIMCYHVLYMAALAGGDAAEGLRWSAEAIRMQQKLGMRNSSTTLEARGNLHLLTGNARDAVRCYGSASLQQARTGQSWPQITGTPELLASARTQLSAEEFAAAWASGERLADNHLIGDYV
ncbi:MAG: BTAD domain-containing putative transcriptional regulator [Actinomycetales bacterium]